jgi:hypothetical protein
MIDFRNLSRFPASHFSPEAVNLRKRRRAARTQRLRLRWGVFRAYVKGNAAQLAAFAGLLAGWAFLTYSLAEFFAGVRFDAGWVAIGHGGARRIVWSGSAGLFFLWVTGARLLRIVGHFGVYFLSSLDENQVRQIIHGQRPPPE